MQSVNYLLLGKVRELNRQLECRDERVGELTAAQDVAKLGTERHLACIVTLQQRVDDCETQHSGLEVAAGRTQQQLATLQQEYRDAQQQILLLKAQIRLQHMHCLIYYLFCSFII